MSNTLEEIAASMRRIEQLLASQSTGVSSVEIKTSTRGYDVATKAYVGSPIREAGDAAVEEFIRVTSELTSKLMGQAA